MKYDGKTRILFLITGIAVLLLAILFFLNQKKNPPLTIEQPLTWNQLTPCVTTKTEVESILGIPNAQEESILGYLTYEYETPINQNDWQKIKIVFNDEQSETIKGILIYNKREDAINTEYELDTLVKEYQKPDLISWAYAPSYRFLAWTNRGLGIIVATRKRFVQHMDEIHLLEVLFFCPMSKENFMYSSWPWPVWSLSNPFPDGHTDTPDTAPRDNFDWYNLFGWVD